MAQNSEMARLRMEERRAKAEAEVEHPATARGQSGARSLGAGSQGGAVLGGSSWGGYWEGVLKHVLFSYLSNLTLNNPKNLPISIERIDFSPFAFRSRHTFTFA